MPIFFTIHNLNWGQDLSHGQRNCRTFLYGVCIYLAIYLIFKNLQLHGYLGGMYDALYSAFIIVLVADMSVMAYLYRSYFGRNILHEITPNDQKKQNWYYDPETHQYSDQPPLEAQLAKELEEKKVIEKYRDEFRQLKEEKLAKREQELARQRTEQIIEDKNRLRAVIKIQRWWRKHQYEPGRGAVYMRAQQDFNQQSQLTN